MTQTILVIDDDDPIRRMVATTLERAGFNVVGVSDGLTGLASVKERRPDLVIVGLLLPWLMGFDVCRRIRELPGGATLPIIVMSTVLLSDDARREIRDHLGIKHILQKPFPFKELLDAVGTLIERSSNEPPYMAERDEGGENAWTPEARDVGLARFSPETSDERLLLTAREPYSTLPELLMRLFRAEATGILTLSDDKRRKEIAFDRGVPVRILAAFPGENVGKTLLDVGRLDAPEFERAVERATRWNLPLEQALVAAHLLTEAELLVFQRLHAHQVILTAFTAYGCTWKFRRTEMGIPESLRVTVDPFVVVWEGVSEALSLQELTNHFLPRRSECPAMTVSYDAVAARLSGVFPALTPIASIDGKTPLAKLLARSNLGIASTLRVLYTLELCGALEYRKAGGAAAADRSPLSVPPSAAEDLARLGISDPADRAAAVRAESASLPSPGFVVDAEREHAAALDQMRARSWGDAVLSSQRAVSASPDDPRLHICLAETYLLSEGLDTRGPVDPTRAMPENQAIRNAEAALVTALQLSPRAPRALCLLARVCLARGRREQALTLFGFARQIDPENEEVRAGLAALSERAPSERPAT